MVWELYRSLSFFLSYEWVLFPLTVLAGLGTRQRNKPHERWGKKSFGALEIETGLNSKEIRENKKN